MMMMMMRLLLRWLIRAAKWWLSLFNLFPDPKIAEALAEIRGLWVVYDAAEIMCAWISTELNDPRTEINDSEPWSEKLERDARALIDAVGKVRAMIHEDGRQF